MVIYDENTLLRLELRAKNLPAMVERVFCESRRMKPRSASTALKKLDAELRAMRNIIRDERKVRGADKNGGVKNLEEA